MRSPSYYSQEGLNGSICYGQWTKTLKPRSTEAGSWNVDHHIFGGEGVWVCVWTWEVPPRYCWAPLNTKRGLWNLLVIFDLLLFNQINPTELTDLFCKGALAWIQLIVHVFWFVGGNWNTQRKLMQLQGEHQTAQKDPRSQLGRSWIQSELGTFWLQGISGPEPLC